MINKTLFFVLFIMSNVIYAATTMVTIELHISMSDSYGDLLDSTKDHKYELTQEQGASIKTAEFELITPINTAHNLTETTYESIVMYSGVLFCDNDNGLPFKVKLLSDEDQDSNFEKESTSSPAYYFHLKCSDEPQNLIVTTNLKTN